MATLEAISESAIAAHEQCVRESIALDYAYQAGKLDEWMDKKYNQVMAAAYGDSSNGANPGTNPGT